MARDKSMLNQIIVGFVEQVIALALAPTLITVNNNTGFTGNNASIAGIITLVFVIAIMINGAKTIQTALQAQVSGKTGIARGLSVFTTVIVGAFLAPVINDFATGTGPTGLANATFSGTAVATLSPLIVVFYLLSLVAVTLSSVTNGGDLGF